MAEGVKPCPQCGKEIQAAAVLCRHCNTRFDGAAAAPPKKSGLGTCLIVAIVVGVGGVVVLGILAALLLPAIARATQRAKVTMCANNLRQLWSMQQVYGAQFGGPKRSMPEQTGGDFWLELERTTPPLIDETSRDVLECPLRGMHDKCDYLGPAVPVGRLAAGDAVGADKVENHGGKGGNVLRKAGDIVELEARDFTSATGSLKP